MLQLSWQCSSTAVQVQWLLILFRPRQWPSRGLQELSNVCLSSSRVAMALGCGWIGQGYTFLQSIPQVICQFFNNKWVSVCCDIHPTIHPPPSSSHIRSYPLIVVLFRKFINSQCDTVERWADGGDLLFLGCGVIIFYGGKCQLEKCEEWRGEGGKWEADQ